MGEKFKIRGGALVHVGTIEARPKDGFRHLDVKYQTKFIITNSLSIERELDDAGMIHIQTHLIDAGEKQQFGNGENFKLNHKILP